MLKICLVVDVEGFISLNQRNPEWGIIQNFKKKIVYLLRGFLYDLKGKETITNLLLKYKVPASLMIVGRSFKPELKESFIDYGYHTYDHKPLTYLSDEDVEKEIKNIYNAVSFSAPMNLIDDPLKPGKILRMLKKQGYKIVVWGGPTIRNEKGEVVVLPSRKKIANPEIVEGIKCVYISNLFNDKTPKNEIEDMLREIEENADKEAVYCITIHEFSHKNTSNIERVLSKLEELREKGKIKLTNLREMANEN